MQLKESGLIKTRIKICGVTSVEDAQAAANAGADAIGLVFYPPSPRAVDVPLAADIASSVGPFVTVVALVVDPSTELMDDILTNVSVNLLQFHGSETAAFCEQWQRPYIKAIRMHPDLNVVEAMAEYPSAQGILLDAYNADKPGGTGEVFDWQRVPKDSTHSIILAGGLKPDNVLQAIEQTKPYAVDVSGGVESTPGKKNYQKIADFISAVNLGANK